MSLGTGFAGKANQAMHTDVSGLIEAGLIEAAHLYTGKGLHRIPIGGDMNKLPFATGLTALEKKLAWAAKYLATKMSGTQALR
eukprot:11338724-Karenia_brevis.AAC.1